MKRIMHWIVIVSSWAVVALAPIEANATQKTLTLTSTGVIVTAAGVADMTIGHEQSLDVAVSGLSPFAVYLVKADGKLVGALNTDETGTVDGSWSTHSHGKVLSLPSSVTLSTSKLIEVTNDAGTLVLTGMFQ